MLNQLLQTLRAYAGSRIDDVKRGRNSDKFASALVQIYAKSMMKALKTVGKDEYILDIQSETDQLCLAIYHGYRSKLKKLMAIGRRNQLNKNHVLHS